MNADIQPIETSYQGYRFRSRLEARWAVYFDALGIKWEYEKEGFDLGTFGCYLPDFYLPHAEIWCEVKAGKPTLPEVCKGLALVHQTRQGWLILHGVPDFRSYRQAFVSGNETGYVDVILTAEYYKSEQRFGTSICGDDAKDWDDVRYAVSQARSARFEHGITPNIRPFQRSQYSSPVAIPKVRSAATIAPSKSKLSRLPSLSKRVGVVR